MKHSARILFAALLLTTALGCEKKKSNGAAAAPVTISIKQPSYTGDQAQITFEASQKAEKFLCRVDINGIEGDYEDCDAEGLAITTRAGERYKVYVKAIVGGAETAAVTRSFAPPADVSKPGAEETDDITKAQASIVNRDSIGVLDASTNSVIVQEKTVTLQFQLIGSQSTDYFWECRVGSNTRYTRCTGESYTFSNLLNDTTYALSVRATDATTGRSSQEDNIQFKVAQPQVQINGIDNLASKTGTHQLQLSYPGANSYACSVAPVSGSEDSPVLGSSQTFNCSNGQWPLSLNSLSAGSYQLNVQALAAGAVIARTQSNFCAQQCAGGGSSGGSLRFGNPIALGYGFQMRVQEGMHITEWSSTKTPGVLSTYRVMADSDPFYLGNYSCEYSFDRLTRRASPDGVEYDYCHSTPTREAYKAINEYRLANNHIEVATDADIGSPDGATQPGYERLAVSVYDADYEFMNSRSRFQNLCGNAPLHHVFQLPMLNKFFLGQVPDAVDFWSCDVKLSNALGGPVETWRVGAFFSIRGGAYVPTCNSIVATCSYPEAVEMVYMALASGQNATPWDFALQAQESILSTLTRTVPNPN